MASFKYKVRDRFGRAVTGLMGGESREAVIAALKKMGYTPVSVNLQKEAPGAKFMDRFKKVKLEDMIMFTRELVALQKAGLPLISSLEALREQAHDVLLRDVLGQLIRDVEGGSTFSEALAKHPQVFSELYINMIRAGEKGGFLDGVLERMSGLMEYEAQTRSKLQAATRYPITVIFTLVIAFLVIVAFVLPRFAELFGRFNVTLPLPTRILLGINYIIRHWWPLCLLSLGSFVFFFNRFIKTVKGRVMWDKFKLKIPVFGPLTLKITMSRFTHMTSMLLASGVPLLQVLELVGKGLENIVVARGVEHIKESVNEGESMSGTMKVSGLFPPIVTQMVAVGEDTGKLDELLLSVSEHYDRQVDYAVKNLTSSIEPFLVFSLGVMVLIMALAIFLPLWDIIAVFRRG